MFLLLYIHLSEIREPIIFFRNTAGVTGVKSNDSIEKHSPGCELSPELISIFLKQNGISAQ